LENGHSVGRDPGCDTVLLGVEVSRKHVLVRSNGALPVLHDLNSRNGLFINGKRTQDQPIGPDDVVRIGEWVGLVLEVATPQAASAHCLSELARDWYAGPRLAALVEPLRRISATDISVVIEGATGTGKDVAARAVHDWSGRTGPWVAVDCGAMPEQLAEALLFGQRKGSFTGADRSTLGYLRAAHGGTLFLDEVLNLPLTIQMKLLRALETRSVVPVGDSQAVSIDVRVVCAAQESLMTASADRRFRSDLMARVEGFTLKLPALRERREDIVPLFFQLFDRNAGAAAGCESKFIESLLQYDWPLNVRELVLLARRLAALHHGEPLKRSMLPERMQLAAAGSTGSSASPGPRRRPTDDESSFNLLLDSLRDHGGNLTRAAAALGLTRARAYRLLDAHPEFDLAPFRKESPA
jgi:DNA-binding NtrC family response regulator